MATVDSRTRISIDELVNGTVISGHVTPDGHLILVTRGGVEIDAGFLASQPIRELWSPTSAYVAGEMVGYSGGLWRALASNTGKPPYFYTSLWTRVIGESSSDWFTTDPDFDGDNLYESWDFESKLGSPVVDLSTVPGEFENGRQSLRISLAIGEEQRFFSKVENVVGADEKVFVSVRGRLLSPSEDATLYVDLVQSPIDSTPHISDPASTIVPPLAPPALWTTDWATYNYEFSCLDAYPRAVVNLVASAPSEVATFLIDYVQIQPPSSSDAGYAEDIENLQNDLAEHVASHDVHGLPDIPSLTLLFENGLV